MGKKKRESPFTGLWHIVSMSEWGEDYLHEQVRAFIDIEPGGMGHFQFGLVSGNINCLDTERDGKAAVEWSWEGGDGADGTPMTGQGWAKLEGDQLKGMIVIHLGDESEFGKRMYGTGPRWEAIESLFDAKCRLLGFNEERTGSRHANTFRRPGAQGGLFDEG